MTEFARSVAAYAHRTQTYDGLPYVEAHLDTVVQILAHFGFTNDTMTAAGYLHDVIEDTEMTAHDVLVEFGEEVAKIVVAATGVGRNRKERMVMILDNIRDFPEGAIVKAADRIANIEASQRANLGLHKMYVREMPDFLKAVEHHLPAEMVDRLRAAMVPNVS